MKHISKFILKHPVTVITITVIITVLLGFGLPRIVVDDNIDEMLPENLPVRMSLNKIDDIFGGSQGIVIAVENENGIFNTSTLRKIKDLTDTLKNAEGIRDVTSLATIKHVEGKDWGLEVKPYLEEVPANEKDVSALKKLFYADDMYAGQLVSTNGKYAAIIALLTKDCDDIATYTALQDTTHRIMQGDEKVYFAGTPALRTILASGMKTDLRTLIPFVILIIIVSLFLSFRTLEGVLLPLLSVLMSVVASVGLMGLMGKKFMMINNTMPVLLIAIGTAYAIHVISKYYESLSAGGSKHDALLETMRDVSIPVLMAALTTIVGFVTLVSSPLPVYAEFGLFTAFGVLYELIIALTFVPAALSLLPVPKHHASHSVMFRNGILTRLLRALANNAIGNTKFTVILSGAVLSIFAIGIALVHVEANPISFFRPKSSVTLADNVVNNNLGGSVTINILVTGDIQDPKILSLMDMIETHAVTYPEISSSVSMAKVVKQINKSLNGNNPDYERIPDTKEAVAQALLVYSMSGNPSDFDKFVDTDYRHAQIIARMKNVPTKDVARITKEMSAYCTALIKNSQIQDISVEVTGFSVLLVDLARLIISSQASSMILSIIIVFMMAWATYRSFRLGLLSILPLTITMSICFGLMGIFNLPISLPTAVIANIVIGCGIDYSFHFLSRFKNESRNHTSTNDAIYATVNGVGKPILYNALSVALGFSTLMFSMFLPLQFLGGLIALAMLTCGICSLTSLASSISLGSKKIIS